MTLAETVANNLLPLVGGAAGLALILGVSSMYNNWKIRAYLKEIAQNTRRKEL